jgi:peptidoglycan hydrolase-like protein with peptidoglycan-binding domain
VWGGYYWYPRWGWYFTAAVAGGTLAYVLNLPDTDPCDQAFVNGETVYICNGIVYRPTVYRDERVYEIVTSQHDSAAAPEISGPIRLTSPRMRGEAVREVQEALVAAGYDVGGVDAIFGPGTDAALKQFQRDNGLDDDGVVGDQTAKALGL